MRKLFVCFAPLFLALLVMAAPGAAQQDSDQLPSPPAKAECKLPDGKTITVNYSSPRMRGRKIYGGLVPYGEVWRAGANEATSFVSNTNLVVGGKDVPAGRYTLFTVPQSNKWTMIVSKRTGIWGIPYPGEPSDFTRTEMSAAKLTSPVQNFTIAFDRTADGCTMRMDWETTRAAVNISQKK